MSVYRIIFKKAFFFFPFTRFFFCLKTAEEEKNMGYQQIKD